ncbi:MAG: guanylate kinase [Oscillospiraceae bacterium]|jgi:guanylate kinase|nr:guanylate kinase [Oscillospiraceae bacterium]
MREGRIIIVSAPSGAGKNTILNRLLQAMPELALSVSLTTRAPRAGEIEGVSYHFVTTEEFEAYEARGEFLECNPYAQRRYGTLRAPVERAIAEGRDILLEIEVKGARDVRRQYPGSLSIFIAPPDFALLRERLTARDTNTADEIEERLVIGEAEMRAAVEFDYIVVNDDLETAVARVTEIIRSTKK